LRNLIVLLITLLLGYLGKTSGIPAAEPIWALGMLLILTPLGAEMAERVGLPSVIGCTAVGLMLGPYGARLIAPEALSEVEILRVLAAGWIAIQIGAAVHEEPGPSMRKVFGLSAFVTWVSCALTAGVLLAAGIPLLPAVTLGMIASSFGPFIMFSPEARRDRIPGVMVAGTVSVFALWSALTLGVEAVGHSTGAVGIVLPVLEFLGAIGLAWCMALTFEVFSPRLVSSASRVLWMFGAILLLGMISHILALNAMLPAVVVGALVMRRSRSARAIIAAARPLSRPLHHLLFGMIGVYLGAGADFASAGRFWPICLAYIACMVMGKMAIGAIGTRLFRVGMSSREPLEAVLLPQGVLTFELLRMSQERFVGLQSFQSSWDLVCTTVTMGLLLGMMVFPVVVRQFARPSVDLSETASEQAS